MQAVCFMWSARPAFCCAKMPEITKHGEFFHIFKKMPENQLIVFRQNSN